MTEMSEKEVLDACSWLEKDYAAGGLPDANSHYTDIYQMNDVAIVSDELSRGRNITNPVPRLSEWVTALLNQVLTYATFPVLTPLGGQLTPTEVDKIEAMIGLMLAEVDAGGRLRKEAYPGFMRRSHVIYQLIPGAAGDRFPFSVELPTIDTCYFEKFKGGRPGMISRSYDMLVKDAEPKYSGKRGYHEGADKKGTWDTTTQRMNYTALSGEWPNEGRSGSSNSGATGHRDLSTMVHVKEFYDGEYCYHRIKGLKPGAQDQEVLRQKLPTDGNPFFVVPSNPQGDPLWREDWRPIGWPGFTRVLQINRIEQIRATRAEHAQEHIISRLPPDQQDAVERLKRGGYTPVLHGGVNFIPIAAEEIITWTQLPDADLVERAREKKEELERWISSWLFPATEQTISQANVGTAQLGMQVVHQNESGLIACHAAGMGAMAEMMVCALAGTDYAGNRELYAKSEVQYGRLGAKKLEPGQSISVSAETLRKVKVYGQDANIRIEVVTRSETESELEQRETGVWNNVQRGSQVFDEYIAVRNPDVEGQHEKLAEDGIRKAMAATYDALIPAAAAKANFLSWGVDVSKLQPMGMPGAAPGAPAAPGGVTTVTQAVPPTGGVDVSSKAGAMSAGDGLGG